MQGDTEIRIGVLGLGHVGLPTALGFAEVGWQVVGADDDREKAERIARGEAPFFEPGLEELLRKHLQSEHFRVAADVTAAVRESDVLFVCVGTPQREDGSADLSQVERVARTIALNLNGYKLIVEKSTAPVRTAEQIKRTIKRYAQHDHKFDVAVNPEFLREGTALRDFFNPDRIVLGVETEQAEKLLRQIYKPLLEGNQEGAGHLNNGIGMSNPTKSGLVITGLNTAELIKHAANAYLAMKISFINLIADLCDATGADVDQVANGLGLDPRIGPHFLKAGLGFGGYCLPKDLRAFALIGEAHGLDMTLLKEVAAINDLRIERFLSKVRQALWVLAGKTLAVWGLAFKPGTDDVRDAPSLKLVAALQAEGVFLRLYDPRSIPEFRRHFPEIPERLVYCDSPQEAAHGSDAILLMTEWPEFEQVDLAQLRESMRLPIIVDGRNCFDPQEARRAGFEYYGMGR